MAPGHRTPCPPVELQPCPLCGDTQPRRHFFPVRVECPTCHLSVERPGPRSRATEVQRWNALAGLALALQRIQATDAVMHLAPAAITRTNTAAAGTTAAVRHMAAIAQAALEARP